MPDLSKMSDEDLLKIANGGKAAKPTSVADLSDEQLMEIASGKKKQAEASSEAPRESSGLMKWMSMLSKGEAAKQGALQTGSFGYSDEIAAAGGALKDKLSSNEPIKDIYGRRVAQERAEVDRAREVEPEAYLAGSVGTAVPMAFVPGIGVARGATLAGGVGRAALSGGLMGSGESTANPLSDTAQFAKDTAGGAAVGGATQGVLSGAGAGLQAGGSALKGWISKGLSNLAEDRAVKAATGQNISALRKMAGTTLQSGGDIEKAQAAIRRVGRDMLDEGSVGMLDTVEDLAPKLAGSRKAYGEQIGKIGEEIDKAVPNAVDSKKIAQEILDYAQDIPKTEAGKKLQDRLMAEAANFEEMGRMSFTDAQKFKNQFKYRAVDADALISNQDATNKIRSIISKNMDETAESIAKKGGAEADLISSYGEVKSKYGSFKSAADAATDRVQKDLSIRFVSPSDTAIGLGTGVAGYASQNNKGGPEGAAKSIAYGALAAMVNKQARTRGSAFVSSISNSIAKALENPGFATKFGNIIAEAAKKGPVALVGTHELLMQDQGYRQQFEEKKPGIRTPKGDK